MSTTPPDDCGIAPTNDPRTHTYWERRGRFVRLQIVRDEPTTGWASGLPPAASDGIG